MLKGLQIVCRFRFLFLENQSDFFWFNVEGWGAGRLPKMARQLLTELGLMQMEAQEAELHKPGTWAAFVSIEDLEAMMKNWVPLEAEIRSLCLRAIEPGADESKLLEILARLKDVLKSVTESTSYHNAILLRAIAAKLAAMASPTRTLEPGPKLLHGPLVTSCSQMDPNIPGQRKRVDSKSCPK